MLNGWLTEFLPKENKRCAYAQRSFIAEYIRSQTHR